eukprot:27938-Amphidinium_carterae.1
MLLMHLLVPEWACDTIKVKHHVNHFHFVAITLQTSLLCLALAVAEVFDAVMTLMDEPIALMAHAAHYVLLLDFAGFFSFQVTSPQLTGIAKDDLTHHQSKVTDIKALCKERGKSQLQCE